MMRKLKLLLAFLLVSASAFASMPGIAHYSFYSPNPVFDYTAYPTISLTASGTVQGYTTCNCPAGIYHQPQITLTLRNHATGAIVAGNKIAYGPQVPPSYNVNFTTSIGYDCSDCFTIFEMGLDSLEVVYCSMQGGPFAVYLFSMYVEAAQTMTIFTGTTSNCQTMPVTGLVTCAYSVNNWCTPMTTPPDLNMDGQEVRDTYPISASSNWLVGGACFRLASGTGWVCGHAVAVYYPGPQPKGNCTYNP